ncbi:hypothetical protein [Hyphobacterium marinum]|uniref:Uncharacterized protein n=1 Tax=Hyphobacterium marinum TaxID=3116574 RepID=A0ABU7LWJ4_9PROT|nr:hypothetical protein [Hyphobacterium sp. Y6023]MEE2565918.1 hypothetical protein [Hyphobacterium sp. Y6023]
MTKFECPVISGAAYSTRRVGSAPDAVRFRIEVRDWDGSDAAACGVWIEDDGDVLVDRDIFGEDPLQALELAMVLLRRLAAMFEPDEEYVAYIKGM